MRTTLGTTQRAALALGAATTFALLGVAAPAQAAPADHHDNRSTSLKEGRGHNDTWQAQADPDGDENGGVDQPGGSGGVDKNDQDGNNGSGNDSDCEDDNRGKGVPGHCKDKPDHAQPSTPDNGKPAETPAETPAVETPADTPAEVPAESPAAPTAPAAPAVPAAEETPATTPEVLGIERTAAAGRAPAEVTPTRTTAAAASPAGVLPNTGADPFALALLAGGLGTIAAGTVLVRRRATEEL